MKSIVQAAVALGSLPPDYASRVMARLEPGDLQRLVSVFPEQRSVSDHDRAAAVEQLAREIATSRILDNKASRVVGSGQVTDHDNQWDHETNVEQSTNRSNHRRADAGKSNCNAVTDWRDLDSAELVELLDGEHPHLIAQALALLAPHQIANAVKHFEPSLRLSIVKRLCELDRISDTSREYLDKLIREKRLAKSAGRLTAFGASRSTAPPTSSAMDGQQGVAPAETCEPVIPPARKVLTFADLAKFSKSDMQTLLKTADTSLWAPALVRTDRAVINNVILNMAPRPAALLMKEIHEQAWVSPAMQEQARSRLLELCQTLGLPTPT